MEANKRLEIHEDLEIFQLAFETAMTIFELSKKFPQEEKYALTDQIRRSSRSVCANLAEAWRKRKYQRELYGTYNQILSDLVKMMTNPDNWMFDQNLLVKESSDCHYQVFRSNN
ncbi:MAG: four helix bundle protein [Cyanosarcina radialis HA8281-LM2]|nr:four helix bundle protein [Cyanosarcina radialis HA8281-LM2]